MVLIKRGAHKIQDRKTNSTAHTAANSWHLVLVGVRGPGAPEH
jgi:hypothetical protein